MTRHLASLACALLVVALAPVTHASTTVPQSEPKYTQRIVEEDRIATPDGTIYGVVERPVVPAGMKVPVILTYSPYHYELLFGSAPEMPGTHVMADAVSSYFVPRGYARAFFDVVGTGDSGGCMDLGGVHEMRTGRAVVEYLATRPWSSGKVGMVGASYAGQTQWGVALTHPPHLTTIVPQVPVSSQYSYAYLHGTTTTAGQQEEESYYGLDDAILPLAVSGGAAWADAVRQRVSPCDEVQGLQHNANLPNPIYDEYWAERNYQPRAGTITTPTLLIGSWADNNVPPEQQTTMWSGLPAATPKRLVMGQAGHSENQLPAIMDLYHAWFDHWLLGYDNHVMSGPKVITVSQTGRIRTAVSWPPAGTKVRSYELVPGSGSKSSLGLGGGTPSWSDVVPYQTEYLPFTSGTGPAALIYHGGVGPCRITGAPRVELDLTTSGVSTHVHAVLADIDPTGSWTAITRAVLNSRYRHGDDRPIPFTAGSAWHASLLMQPVDWELAPGHSLALLLTSVNGTQSPYGDTVKSTNTLTRGRLQLPLAT